MSGPNYLYCEACLELCEQYELSWHRCPRCVDMGNFQNDGAALVALEVRRAGLSTPAAMAAGRFRRKMARAPTFEEFVLSLGDVEELSEPRRNTDVLLASIRKAEGAADGWLS